MVERHFCRIPVLASLRLARVDLPQARRRGGRLYRTTKP